MRLVLSYGASVPEMMTTERGDFAADSAVSAQGDGRYAAAIGPAWGVPRGAHGGFVAAVIVRAFEAELAGQAGAARSLSCHFLKPIGLGPLQISVSVERRGRVVTSLLARVVQDDSLVAIALAVFGHSFGNELDFDGGPAAPDVGPAPDSLPPFVKPDGVWTPPFVDQLSLKHAFGGTDLGAESCGWMRLNVAAEPDAAALAFYADAWLPTPFMVAQRPALAPTIDYTVHFRSVRPAPGFDSQSPLLARFRTERTVDGYFVEDGCLWTPQGVLLAEVRQMGCLLPFTPPAA